MRTNFLKSAPKAPKEKASTRFHPLHVLVFMFLALSSGMVWAQTLNVTICSQEDTNYNINGVNAVDTRAKLSNPAFFGPSGSFCDVNFSYVTLPTNVVTENALTTAGCNIVWSGFELDASWSAAELTELNNWIANTGGQVIAGCDVNTLDPVCASLGLVLNTDNVAAGTTSIRPDVTGCFPNTVGAVANGGGAVTNFLTVPAGLHVIGTQDDLAPVRPSAVFGNGIFATTDINMIASNPASAVNCCLSAGANIINGNDQFLGDGMCALAAASQGQASCLNEEGTLTLLKTVVNDHGGTALETDFTMTATGPTTISGQEGDGSITAAVVPGGSYTLSEAAHTGYTQTSLTCSGGADTDPSDGLDVAAGETIVCTFTNDDDDNLTTLTVEKTASINPVVEDTPFTYTITVTDALEGTDATNVQVTDVLDSSLTCNSVTVSNNTTTGSTSGCAATVTCNWTTIPDGGSETCIIEAEL